MSRNQFTYDKPRIVSTVIIGIVLLALLVLSIVFIPVTWGSIKVETDGSAEEAVAAPFIVLAAGLGIVAIIVYYVLSIILSGLCFMFSFKNRCSIYKPIRIISYVYDGLFISLSLLAIIKIILYIAGV